MEVLTRVKEPAGETAEEANAVSIMDLRIHHCRWPLDKKDNNGLVMYCGKPKIPGSSYCYAHSWRSRR